VHGKKEAEPIPFHPSHIYPLTFGIVVNPLTTAPLSFQTPEACTFSPTIAETLLGYHIWVPHTGPFSPHNLPICDCLEASNKVAWLRKALMLSPAAIQSAQQLTVGQRNNPYWSQLRKMRLTASNIWCILQAIANNKQVDYINVSEYIVSLTMLDVFSVHSWLTTSNSMHLTYLHHDYARLHFMHYVLEKSHQTHDYTTWINTLGCCQVIMHFLGSRHSSAISRGVKLQLTEYHVLCTLCYFEMYCTATCCCYFLLGILLHWRRDWHLQSAAVTY